MDKIMGLVVNELREQGYIVAKPEEIIQALKGVAKPVPEKAVKKKRKYKKRAKKEHIEVGNGPEEEEETEEEQEGEEEEENDKKADEILDASDSEPTEKETYVQRKNRELNEKFEKFEDKFGDGNGLKGNRKKVWDAVNSGAETTDEIAKAIPDMEKNSVPFYLTKLVNEDRLVRFSRGRYKIKD